MDDRDALLKSLADRLSEAETSRESIGRLTDAVSDLSIPEAYRIQLVNVERKVELGDQITGKKIGLTSMAMQQLLGVDQPDFGHLLASMEVADGHTDASTMVQPRIEGEIAFILADDLPTSGVTPEQVLSATEKVVAALEIVDSRVANWKIAIQDTVADNASSGRFVLGAEPKSPEEIDLPAVRMDLLKNGEVVNSGVGAAVLDHPANAVAWLANAMGEFGVQLKAGEVVLSGALSAMIPVDSGDFVEARFDTLGTVSVRFD